MRKTSFVVSAILSAVISGVASASGGVHWSYTGHESPEHWGSLDKSFATCSHGKNQSPINISGAIESELPALGLVYKAGEVNAINNGHTVQVNVAAGNALNVDGKVFELKQFHFHAPSENAVKGELFPMEAHLVHTSENGELAVVAVLFKQGEENKELAKVWKKLPAKARSEVKVAGVFDILNVLPTSKDYYRFNGSLTTPPCTEGVRWFVLKAPVEVSKSQLNAFTKVMKHDNNRPVQPKNARPVLQ